MKISLASGTGFCSVEVDLSGLSGPQIGLLFDSLERTQKGGTVTFSLDEIDPRMRELKVQLRQAPQKSKLAQAMNGH